MGQGAVGIEARDGGKALAEIAGAFGAGGGDFGGGGEWLAGAALGAEAPEVNERGDGGVEGTGGERGEFVRSDGDAGEFRWGSERKLAMLAWEAW